MNTFQKAIFGLVLLAVSVARAADFEAANSLYDDGKFLEAKQGYERLIGAGEWSANLFHNLGNAHHRLGAPGLAALHYERALTLQPGHPEARRNLGFVREQTGARLPEPGWRERLFPPMSENALAIGGAVAAWLAIFCLARILRRGAAASANVWLVLIVACFAAAYAGGALWLREQDRALAVVTEKKGATARLAPADRAEIEAELPAASRVRVLSERGAWIYCALPGGGRGWLPASAVQRVRLPRA